MRENVSTNRDLNLSSYL